MFSFPDTSFLRPVSHGDRLFAFPFNGTELVKLDLICEAGSAYQTFKLSAAATAKLMTVATRSMDSAALSEFFDFRGILVESSSDILQNTTTFYYLRRYADELLPVIHDIVMYPAFNEEDFEVWRAQRKIKIMQSEQKTADIARRMFYSALFSEQHPLGRHATPADADLLTLDAVKEFYSRRYIPLNTAIVVAGNIDDQLISSLGSLLPASSSATDNTVYNALGPSSPYTPGKNVSHNPSATQTSLRIGRILPLSWDSMEYAQFMLLTTILGGYFGSRLMSNLREEKGYTYGIYARTQIYRGVIVFYILADVTAGKGDAAVEEIWRELERLRTELVTEAELELVKTVMAGDFLRSVDGIFERSARFCDMYGTGVDERLTANIRTAINETTPRQILSLAQQLLSPDSMVCCLAGA